MHVEAFLSVEDWNRKKPGYEWLFPFIDKNADGKISRDEHQAFQDYKQKDTNWATTLKAKPLAELLQGDKARDVDQGGVDQGGPADAGKPRR